MTIQIQLDAFEALVIFELLSSGKLIQVTDTSEANALDLVLAQLQKQLVAPFAHDYSEQLAMAKSSLLERYGEQPSSALRESTVADSLVVELRRFVLTYAEHDPDCPGTDANAWTEQRRVCVCGLAPRLDELLEKINKRLA